jgi:uncharacterized membrane protein (UPF0182 family)
VIGAVVLFFVITSLRGIAGFYTDYLWFDSLRLAGVWQGVLGAKLALAILFTVGFFLLMLANLTIADRLAPPFRPAGPEDEFLERYHDLVGGRAGWVRASVALLLALIAGPPVAGEWKSWLLFTNGGDFGVDDPQFGMDIGFYVFKLPFLSFLASWLFAAFLIVFIVTAVAHYLNGGIRVGARQSGVTPQVKAHLSVLLGVLALVKAVGYWLQRYDLTVSTRGFVDGAGYTDIKAQLPAINLLMLISVASFALFIVNIWRRGWTLPILGVGLWALVAVVAGAIYPEFIQRVRVSPNEPEREQPYIGRNIEATREAMGLAEDDIEITPFELTTDKDDVDLVANAPTVENIRIWDPSDAVLGLTFPQLQRVRDYYRMNDVDVDRYEIDGKLTQVLLSVRDLRTSGVPRTSWAARHLTYTHGYGAVVAPANAKLPSGEPVFIAQDIPHSADAEALELTQPALYFGEGLDGYVITGSRQQELSYQADDETVYEAYEGADGIPLGNLVRRAAFALRFGDPNPLISSQVSGDSKIHLIRDIRERVSTIAPFLHYDADPYPVISEGRIKWIIDAYTTTNRFPYGQRADTTQLEAGSGLDHDFNYVRNSVKVVVDAYDGRADFYVMPVDDPIIEAYRKAFPELFVDFAEMPMDLQEHLRYPEDLFRIQTNMWARYHVGNPSSFYEGNDYWDVARDPGTAGAGAGTQTTDEQGNVIATRDARIDPYYLMTKLPGAEEPEFLLMRPYVPTSQEDDNQLLTAFMVGKSDGENYGKLQVFVMPRDRLPNGPALVQGEIQRDPDVSREETILSGQGSTVSYGSLTAIPIDGGLVYVRPFYVTSRQTQVPGLERVIVYFEGEVAIADSLEEALADIFSTVPEIDDGPDVPPDPDEPVDPDEPAEPDEPIELSQDVAVLLAEANELFEQADEALADADLETYARLVREARERLDEAERLLEEAGATTTTAPTTTTEAEPTST